jgi:hypothetical protein
MASGSATFVVPNGRRAASVLKNKANFAAQEQYARAWATDVWPLTMMQLPTVGRSIATSSLSRLFCQRRVAARTRARQVDVEAMSFSASPWIALGDELGKSKRREA